MSLHEEKIKYLEEMAARIRYDTIESVINAGSGHIAGPLDMADIFTAMYFHILRHDPKNPDWPERDRLILSNGHICPVRYAAMARSGYFPVEELKTLRNFGTRLQGHPHRTALPGVETTSGPLGSGLSQAVGMAIAAKMDKKKFNIYCLMSDGEQEAGQTWEAAMLAGKLLENAEKLLDKKIHPTVIIKGYRLAAEKAKKIQTLGEEEKIEHLLEITKDKGIAFAVRVAKQMNDPYVLDTFHDILVKEWASYKQFLK